MGAREELFERYRKNAGTLAKRAWDDGDQSPKEAAALAQVHATLALAVAVEHNTAKDRSGTLIDTLERLRFALGKLTAQVADRR
ncbi:hypothetical protein ACFZBU_45350 [Embleya sp. NPDC008237]|uniref:hypothetical protein n=1 Tax=Embleya sp. NPDC008237 TaxID=3363978 RepID=UPI0036EDC51B